MSYSFSLISGLLFFFLSFFVISKALFLSVYAFGPFFYVSLLFQAYFYQNNRVHICENIVFYYCYLTNTIFSWILLKNISFEIFSVWVFDTWAACFSVCFWQKYYFKLAFFFGAKILCWSFIFICNFLLKLYIRLQFPLYQMQILENFVRLRPFYLLLFWTNVFEF